MSTKKTINLEKEEWVLIQGCIEEKLAKLGALEWPLNTMASAPFMVVYQKVATLLSEEDKPKSSS